MNYDETIIQQSYVLNIHFQGMFEKDIKLHGNNSIIYLIDMMSMIDLVAINVETPRIVSDCFLEKEFIESIYMNP